MWDFRFFVGLMITSETCAVPRNAVIKTCLTERLLISVTTLHSHRETKVLYVTLQVQQGEKLKGF